MKFNKIFRIALAFAAGASLFTSCEEENDSVAMAVQTKETFLTFDAKNAEPQVISVFADGTWNSDVSEDWLDINPKSGDKNTEVTVTILSDNIDASGKLNAPREAVITFRGSSSVRQGQVYVTQKGDNYLGVDEYTVTEAVQLDDEAKVKIPSATVMAVSKVGFVLSDGTTTVYAEGAKDVKCGDKVSLNGSIAKLGEFVGIKADEVNVLSSGDVEYPDPVVIETGITSPFTAVTYVKAAGTVIGSLFRLADGNNCVILDPVKDIDLSAVNIHKVEILGYYVGNIDKQYSFVACSLTDKGEDKTVGKELPYRDDFSWLAPYIEMANSKLPEANKISDCVGVVTSSSDGCANIYTTLANNGCDVLGQLRSRGYTDLNPAFKTIYLQDAYFKFGANKKQSGLTLPLFRLDGEQDIVVSFKWCSQMQGDGVIDKTQLVLEIDGPGTVETASGTSNAKMSDPVSHSQTTGKMFWQDVMFTIKGATTATAISFHPSVFGHDGAQESGYYRYYVDDIEVMLAADAVKANINVDGIDSDLITFEGTPEAPYTFKVTSDVDFNVSASANWLHVENGAGLAGETKTVSVTCDPSELSVLRKGEITIKSGVTSKKIQVVQSAAGGELEPFISIVGGNKATVEATQSTMSVKIQANVPFRYDCDVDWITPAAQKSSLVSVTEGAFTVAANNGTDERTAHIRFYNDKYGLETIYTVKQLSDHATLPVKWTLRSSCNFHSTWPFANTPGVSTTEGENGYMSATTGVGTIWFNNANGVAADENKKCMLDVSDESPRVTGVWIGDYCQFKVPGKVDKGRKVRISFETRVSATHPKYWRLQYLDGETWKDACNTKTVNVDGEGEVVYTHTMASDGKTNIQVDATVTYGANTDNVVFRFICQTAMQANGKGCLAAPNGGSWRLSVTNKADDDQWQPTIQYAD